ncbi:NAD(P)-dependent dehydrogenase (short-subunit alcohol dehydrogenase family) [Actinoplanes tereljensis]|uniref:Short-chain dehydrogenase n=1 Tax=Paractinoplanes tereljensis TaxID=571912 RepID=A0A919NMX4_9ACTN|nr:short-chain dehydrogenase [Actinoplanes tereljensis]GIF20517.1 hypothetical protein Ate02nite_32470 [Actinoplanes tereljensis]
MGLALARSRAARGDEVIVLGRDPRLLGGTGHFLRVDLSDVADTLRVIEVVRERWPVVDAVALFANGQGPRRVETRQGLERTFALYYLSRYLLGRAFRDRAAVIVNVAGVGITKGTIAWDDLQLTHGYGMVRAQLQAGRLNDLLGVVQSGAKARYVLYHPGFTRSGELSPLPAPLRVAIKVAAALKARPVEESIRPVHGWLDHPPAAPLTAVDRGRELPLSLSTLDAGQARRLELSTEQILLRAGAVRSD